MPTWPNFFIAGAPKAGTSSLHAYFRDIDGVHMSRIKEPNYFSRVIVPDDHPIRPVRDERKYLALFAGATTETIIGEASPTYLADPRAPALIDAASPQAKVIVSLRDPVERAYSHYLMMLNNGRAGSSFMSELERGIAAAGKGSVMLLRPEIGLYHDQVERFLGVFGEERFKVLIFEEFIRDPKKTVLEVLQFLGVASPLENFRTERHRQYGVPRSLFTRFLFGNVAVARLAELIVPPGVRSRVREALLVKPAEKPAMEASAREFLKSYYAEDVSKLQRSLGRSLPWRHFATKEP